MFWYWVCGCLLRIIAWMFVPLEALYAPELIGVSNTLPWTRLMYFPLPLIDLLVPFTVGSRVAKIHLINPLSILLSLNPVAVSYNLAILSSLSLAASAPSIALLCIYLATLLRFHSVILIVPVILLSNGVQNRIHGLILFCVSIGLFYQVYILHLSETDSLSLAPNIGMFWYIFTLMFQRFSSFFHYSLILQPICLVIPLFTILQYAIII